MKLTSIGSYSTCKSTEVLHRIFISVFLPLSILLLLSFNSAEKSTIPDDQIICFQDTGDYQFREIIKLVEKQTNLVFSYNPQIIDIQKIIPIANDTLNLKVLLEDATGALDASWSIIDRHIVIYLPDKVVKSDPETSILDTLTIIFIKGKIIDRSNGESVPYANISVENMAIGTIANQEGEFAIKLSPTLLNERLVFNCIGYMPLAVGIIELLHQSKNDIVLEPKYVSIPEVIIRKTEPARLLMNVLNKIPENYNTGSVLLTGFYRETIKKNNQYIMISEAAINTYKSGYNSVSANDQVKIIKSRKDDRISSTDTLLLKLKGGLGTIIALDIIKDRPDFLDPESFKYYNYYMDDIVSQNNRDLYVISFKQKEIIEEALYEGKIYIDINSLALVSCEFNINSNKISKASGYFILKKPLDIKIKPIIANYQVVYTEVNNLYYLSFVKVNTGFYIRKKNQLSGSNFYTNIEMVTTNIDSVGVKRFKPNETARPNSIFTEEATPDYSYWEDYNYIEPTRPLEEALKKYFQDDN